MTGIGAPLAQAPEELGARHVGEVQVEEYQLGLGSPRRLEALEPRRGGEDFPSQVGKRDLEEPPDLGLVVDD